jgi:hypothetical protein
VAADLLDVLALARGARAQVGAAGAQRRALLLGTAAGQLDQAELDVVERQRVVRAVVEMLDRLRALLGLGAVAADAEIHAAATDGDVERGLDLPKVLVERAAQVGQPPVVFRRQAQFDDVGLQAVSLSARATSPRRLCG